MIKTRLSKQKIFVPLILGILLFFLSVLLFQFGNVCSEYFHFDTLLSINSKYALGFILYYSIQLIHTVYKAELLLNKQSSSFLMSQLIFIALWVSFIVFVPVKLDDIPLAYIGAFIMSSILWRCYTKTRNLGLLTFSLELMAILLLWFL